MSQFGIEDFPEILQRAQRGDEAAFRVIYRTYHPGLLRFLRSRLGADAEDVAAEVWVSVTKGLSKFVGDEIDFRAWIFATGRRRMIDLYRRRAVRPQIAQEADVQELSGIAPSEQLEIDEAVAALVEGLTEEQAEIVLLRVLGGFSAKEVGDLLGKSEASIRVTQHRALAKLAEHLKDKA
ncbi:RNA polymerase sigma factor [Ferrimicrobium sp.]|uniref:RNA polymerase sigma factor n=1 Tax=Ferrimicrobium sp. TaxID=2926050 RepID=UPI002622697F|nr:RNA polymerase sigma factor [Ferrimicrobium sp.]